MAGAPGDRAAETTAGRLGRSLTLLRRLDQQQVHVPGKLAPKFRRRVGHRSCLNGGNYLPELSQFLAASGASRHMGAKPALPPSGEVTVGVLWQPPF